MDFGNSAYIIQNGWRFQKLRNNYIKIYWVGRSDMCLLQNGTDLTYTLPIPTMHRLINFRVHHLTSLYADSSDVLTIKLQRKQGMPKYENELLIDQVNYTLPHFRWNAGLGWEFEPSTYTITLNTTDTNLVCPIILIQDLE